MGPAAQDQVQPARFRAELIEKFGSWTFVAIVYALSAVALFHLVGFLKSLNELSHLTNLLTDPSQPASRDAVARAIDLNFELNVRGTLLGLVTVLTVIGGGSLFLRHGRRLERLLAKRAAEIDDIDKSRRLFFAKASHELRTPVTVMKGEAELALDDTPNDAAALQEALRHVVANAAFLGHRLEEMIGLARAADGQLHLDSERLDLREVVAAAVADARWFAGSVEVRLSLSMPDHPVTVNGDALWLKRAALALIENAIKFSPIGGWVTVELSEREEFAKVEVADRGPGVVSEELPLIFEAYYQTSNGKDRGGSGLGLAMTRWVAEQHGGEASAYNRGHPRHPYGCAVLFTVRREPAA